MVVRGIILNWRCLSTLCSDSNTKTVLLSKQCFSKSYQNGSTSKSNIFKVIVSKWFFVVWLNWRSLSKQCFDSNTKTVLLSKRCFSKTDDVFQNSALTVIPKRYYCQISVFKEIPQRCYCQGSVFRRSTKMVSPSNLMFSM